MPANDAAADAAADSESAGEAPPVTDADALAAAVTTTNAGLQARLDQLVVAIQAGDKEAFVRAFVPLDLSEQDLLGCVLRVVAGARGGIGRTSAWPAVRR